jgi:hypothetical protein
VTYLGDPWGYYHLQPWQQVQLRAYHAVITQPAESTAQPAAKAKVRPEVLAAGDALARAMAPKEWARRTGSTPEAIAWASDPTK